jgi:lysophospholipase L1-like esterase
MRALAKVAAAAAIAGLLCACGGGAGDDAAAPACRVTVQLFGDSTQEAQGVAGTLANLLEARFPGVVDVETPALGATDVRDLPPCIAHPYTQGVCESAVKPGAIVVVNTGINDALRSLPLQGYTDQLRAFAASVPTSQLIFETPGAIDPSSTLANGNVTTAQAAAMRALATERGAAIADVQAYMLAIPDWRARLVDGLHPTPALYAAIATDVLFPRVRDAVSSRTCQ